jgi:hypothetical protein
MALRHAVAGRTAQGAGRDMESRKTTGKLLLVP